MSIHKRRTHRRDAVYDSRLRDPAGRVYTRTFNTKREAEDYEAQERNGRNRGTWVDHRRAKTTFNDVAAEWLASNPAKRPSARVRDEGVIRLHLVPVIGGRSIGAITPLDVQRMVNAWAEVARPRTVKRQYGVLRAVLVMAVQRDYIGRTPCRGIRLPEVEQKVRRIVTPDELAALADAAGRNRPMIYVGAVLGLRWGEVAALRVRDVDFLRGELTVSHTLSRGAKGVIHEGPPKSDLGRRTMAVPAPLMAMLSDHLAEHGLTGADSDCRVFASPEGCTLAYNNWRRRAWAPACEAVGLEGLGFHDLRAACATGMVAEGVDVKTAQTRLGHSDPRLTLAIYAQATTAADRAAADRLAEHFLIGSRDRRAMDRLTHSPVRNGNSA